MRRATRCSMPVARVHSFGVDAVVTGLAGQEQVITEGKQNLRPGGAVKIAPAAGAAGDGAGKGKRDAAAEKA